MDPKFSTPPSQPNNTFNQHSTQTLSHLDILCVYYPSQEAIPPKLPIVVKFKIGDEANRSHIFNSRIPDALYVHKSYLPNFPEFFSVSHKYQLNPFSTYFEIIPHPWFVALSDFHKSDPEATFLPVLDPRGTDPNQIYQSESDVPYLLIPDPRLVTPKTKYNLNPDFPWNNPVPFISQRSIFGTAANFGKPPFGTQYLFACFAQDLCKHLRLEKGLERIFTCADCYAKLRGQNYLKHSSQSKKDGKKPMEQQSKEKKYCPNKNAESIGSCSTYWK